MTKKPKQAVSKVSKSTKASTKKPVLLSGGNPQIAKADWDTPVQAYIAAMPGWKNDVGRRLRHRDCSKWLSYDQTWCNLTIRWMRCFDKLSRVPGMRRDLLCLLHDGGAGKAGEVLNPGAASLKAVRRTHTSPEI